MKVKIGAVYKYHNQASVLRSKLLCFFVLRQNISLTWRCRRFQQVLQFLSLCLAPMAFKLGGILIVLQVLWHEKKAIVVIQTKGTKDLSRWICIHHLHFNTRTIHSFLFILAYIFVFHFGMLEC